MSLFDIAGDYRTRAIERPAARGVFAAALAALRRPQDHGAAAVAEDASAARHRRREQGYLADIGI